METTIIKTKNSEGKALPTLEEMLAAAPKEAFELTDEDRLFLNTTVGREIIIQK